MRKGFGAGFSAILITAISATALSAQAAPKCSAIRGQMSETIVPASQAPNDPFGRILGMFVGSFGGDATNVAVTAFLVTPPAFSAPSGPSAVMQVRHVFLVAPGETVITLGKTIFTPGPATQPGQTNFVNSVCPFAPCVVQNPQVLDIIGGTGRYEKATGQLRNIGSGNLDLPNGKGTFSFTVEGEVCLPKQ